MNAVIQNLKNFYDTNVFYAILATGIFLLIWDYPMLKAMKHKNDTRVTLIMGVTYVILPFVLYFVTRM